MDLFAEKLTRLKNERGIKQNQLADFVGVSPRAVKNWLDGTSDVTTANFFRICDFFNVSPEYFYSENSLPPPTIEGCKTISTVNGQRYEIPRTTYYMDSPAWEPRIHEGDLLLIDEKQEKLISGALYLFMTGENYAVYRYFHQALLDLHYLIEGNQNHKDADSFNNDQFNKLLNLQKLVVMGRVIGRCTSDI